MTLSRSCGPRDTSSTRLTVEDARVEFNCPLRSAAHNGHVRVVRELRKWGLTIADARMGKNFTLEMAMTKGYLPVVQELGKWGLTREDAREFCYQARWNKHFSVVAEVESWKSGGDESWKGEDDE